MKREYYGVRFNGEVFTAEVTDGEVIGWQPITLKQLNSDIDKSITYLMGIKEAMLKTKEKKEK